MRRGRPPYPELVTPREQQVLDLIRDGLTNEQIAVRLGISFSGARYHVAQILSKLGVGSRQEAALWKPQPPDARRYGLFGGMLGRLMGFTLARAAAGLAVAAAVAMLGGLLLGTVAMRGREAQIPEAVATPSELSTSPLDQAKQALSPPYQNRPTPVPRPDESSAVPVDAAGNEEECRPGARDRSGGNGRCHGTFKLGAKG
jgi:DNA-binding CsgD family transcriptional regulator